MEDVGDRRARRQSPGRTRNCREARLRRPDGDGHYFVRSYRRSAGARRTERARRTPLVARSLVGPAVAGGLVTGCVRSRDPAERDHGRGEHEDPKRSKHLKSLDIRSARRAQALLALHSPYAVIGAAHDGRDTRKRRRPAGAERTSAPERAHCWNVSFTELMVPTSCAAVSTTSSVQSRAGPCHRSRQR
jgi:hypothetical protein